METHSWSCSRSPKGSDPSGIANLHSSYDSYGYDSLRPESVRSQELFEAFNEQVVFPFGHKGR